MIDTELFNEINEPLLALYRQAEQKLLESITSAISRGAIGTAEYEVERLRAMGTLNNKAKRIIAETTKKSQKIIDEIFKKATAKILKTYGVNDVETEGVKQVIMAMKRQASNSLNLVNTKMLSGTINKATQIFTNMSAKASEILSEKAIEGALGNSTIQKIIKQTVIDLNNTGINCFMDSAGRNWNAESYVKMDIRTTLSNTANEIVIKQGNDYGLDVILVSSHAGARPKCAPYQGRCFSMSNRRGTIKDANGTAYDYEPISTTSYGEPDGLFGINCHHSFRYISEGAFINNEPTFNAKENKELYDLSQKQRAMERSIRKNRREYDLLKKSKSDTGNLWNKYLQKRKDYKAFCDKNNLRNML